MTATLNLSSDYYGPAPTPGPCNFCTHWDSTSYTSEKPVTIASLGGRFQAWMNDMEMELLRRWNIEPTVQGIRDCFWRHCRALLTLRSLPYLRSRFDRRIPCWRSGRWKSLT